MNIKVLCDSMCDIPEEIKEKDYLEIIPLTINIDGKEYKDGGMPYRNCRKQKEKKVACWSVKQKSFPPLLHMDQAILMKI